MDLPVFAIMFGVILALFGVFANFLIFTLVLLPSSSNQLNSPNRVLLLHLSTVCFSLSILYLWIFINNSIISTTSSSKLSDIATALETTTGLNDILTKQISFFSKEVESTSESLFSNYYMQQQEHACSLIDLMIQILQPISLWTISCIHFDRYYAICSPLHYNTLFTTKKVLIFLASGWTMMIFTLLPKVLMTSNNCRMMRACWFQSIDHFENIMTDSQQDSFWWKVHLLFSTILTIFLPISLITVCNLRILTIANYQRHKIANAIFEATLSAQVAITHQKNPYAMPFFYQFSPNALEVRRKSKKATFVVFELIIIVVVLYLPYYIFMIWLTFYLNEQNTKFWKNEQRLDYLNMAIFTVQYIILLSPTINACLYGLNNKTIKENLKNIWRKKKTKIELLHEIQNRTPSTSGSRRPSLTDNLNIPQLAPSNLLHLQQKPILNRQLSDFFFGTSSSLTCHNISDDLTLFHTNKMHRTPSDSLFLNSHDWPHEHYHLSPIKNSQNFRMTPSISKNLLNNFKKLLVSSKNDLRNDIAKSGEIGFPQILVTKHSDTIIYQQQINRNNSGNQQVDLVDNYEKEPFLTQTLSLNDFTMSLPINSKKFMTL